MGGKCAKNAHVDNYLKFSRISMNFEEDIHFATTGLNFSIPDAEFVLNFESWHAVPCINSKEILHKRNKVNPN